MLTVCSTTSRAARYELGERIGQGGAGTVFRGKDLRSGDVVAIKRLRQEARERDASSRERFRREGVALQKLRHPNIVRILDMAEDGEVEYLVMEYVSGGSLEDLLLSTERLLPIERVLRISLAIADALSRAHDLEIVHRDVKPSNVLLAEDGTPRLTDFGVAYFARETRISAASAIVGTTDYLSPESLRGHEVGPTVDIWSFGVLLFEMLTRRRPFSHDSVAQTLHSIVFSSPPDLKALRPDCPEPLVDLVYGMLAKNPGQRVPSARQVAAELDNVLHGRSSRSFAVSVDSPGAAEPKPALRNNLTCEPTTFVGRQSELSELLRWVRDDGARLVTILAPGGMGKTRLALELGHRVVAEALALRPDRRVLSVDHGVFFVQLAPLGSPTFVASAIAEAVGLQFYAGREPEQQLVEYFREKRALLILDNFEHVLDSARLVDELFRAAPGLVVVATSRERLGLTSERLFTLAGLELPEASTEKTTEESSAVRLFLQGARQQRSDFVVEGQLDEVVRICRLVEGMPLGIVLAASWAGALSPREIGEEIGRGLDFLSAELRDLPARQRSMRAVFDHSWTLLEEPAREALQGLSVFRGGFTREAAQGVTGAAVHVLASLMNKSLLRRDPDTGRYEAHELLRQYSEEKLRDDASRYEATRRRHAEYFARFLHEREAALKSPSPRRALVEIEAELDNVRAAWAHMLDSELLEPLALCMEALNVFHTNRASFGEGEAAFKLLVEALSTAGDVSVGEKPRLSARGLSMRALFLRQQGRYCQAEQLLSEALERLDERHFPRERAFALVAAGSTKTKTGNLSEGRVLAERALELYRVTGDAWGLATTLETLGRIHGTSGDFRRAEVAFRESVIVQREAGLMQSGLMGLSVATVQQGRYAEGCRMMLDALDRFEKAGDVWNKMRCQMNLANVQRNLGNYGSAEALARSCLSFWQDVGNWDHEAWCYFQLGNVFKEQGDYQRAGEMFTLGHARSEQAGDAGKIALAKLEFGGLARIRGDYAEAKRLLQESLEGFESSGQTWGTALALDWLGYVACEEGDWRLAGERFQRALRLAMSLRLYPFSTNIVAGIASLRARTGAPEEALELISLVRHHPATERHTLTCRVEPLLAELQGTLPQDAFERALERGKHRSLESAEQGLDAFGAS
ncbi:MAG TPA: protein kinase [Polyangiaceae bacterium]